MSGGRVEAIAAEMLAPSTSSNCLTVGTLTRAFPFMPSETWSTGMAGIPLAGIGFRFG